MIKNTAKVSHTRLKTNHRESKAFTCVKIKAVEEMRALKIILEKKNSFVGTLISYNTY